MSQSNAAGAAANVGGNILGLVVDKHRAEKQWKQEKEMTQTQYENQRKLNEQGNEMQYDMWKKTNYGPQVEMMKEAGLNPGLMYGMKGGGGVSTGSQGGGQASKGSAATQQKASAGMDISQMMMGAQMELMKQQARKAGAEATLIGGGKTENTGADTELKQVQAENIRIANMTDYDEAISKIELNNAKFIKAIEESKTEAGIRESKIQGQIQANLESVQKVMESKSRIKLNNAQITNMVGKLVNDSVRLGQAQDQIGINDRNASTNERNSLEKTLMRLLNENLGQQTIDLNEKKMWVEAGVKTIGNIVNVLRSLMSKNQTRKPKVKTK